MTDATFPAYLVRGEDSVLVAEAVRRLVRQLVGDADLGLVVEEVAGGDDSAGPRAAEAARTPPFLSDRRVVVVRDAEDLGTEGAEALVTYLEDPLPTTALVLAGRSVPQRLANRVKKVGHVVAAGPEARERKAWTATRFKDAAVHLDREAAGLVAGHLGEDLSRLDGLLRLLEAAYGPGARLGVEEVEPFLGEAGGVAPWELTDAIDRGDVDGALHQLHRLLDGGGRHPLQLLATLHTHYTHLLRLDGAGLADGGAAASALGVHPFRAGKLLEQSRRLGHRGVSQAIALLARADLDLKGARDLSNRLVLEVLVARLSRLSGPTARRSGR